MTHPYAVEMQDVVIRFPGVLANDHVNFTLKRGEIHALLGENGAGKSTLMNALAGLYKPSAGTIKIKGQPVSFNAPKDAIAAGVGMVHQHFMLVQTQTVTENVLLGLNTPRFFMRLSNYDKELLALQEQFGLHVNPTAKIWQLSVGEQQRVEILKMLYRGADILIMDEPTAVLAPQEIDELMVTLRAMTKQGKAIVFISHKLREVEQIADRVTVLRKGKVTAEGQSMQGVNKADLARLMVGREVVFTVKKDLHEPKEVILTVQNVRAENNKGVPALKGVSFDIRGGEILGIAGVAGNGQRELAEAITGLRPCQGEILVNGQLVSNQPPITAIRNKVAHIPEDRNHVGSAPNLSIIDNTIMKNYRHDPIGRGWTINFPMARDHAQQLKRSYDILAPTVDIPARNLSGGNLQKVILAREINTQPNLLIAVQPTRGLDVGAIESIQRLLLQQCQAGAAVLLISEELEEILSLSDRIAVMFDGQIMGMMPNDDTIDIHQIGLMMTGSRAESALP